MTFCNKRRAKLNFLVVFLSNTGIRPINGNFLPVAFLLTGDFFRSVSSSDLFFFDFFTGSLVGTLGLNSAEYFTIGFSNLRLEDRDRDLENLLGLLELGLRLKRLGLHLHPPRLLLRLFLLRLLLYLYFPLLKLRLRLKLLLLLPPRTKLLLLLLLPPRNILLLLLLLPRLRLRRLFSGLGLCFFFRES